MSSQIITKQRIEKLRDARLLNREEAYKEAASIIGKSAVTELRQLYELFDERIIIWLAKLWDPETGAFYYSNSARDTELFLPDVESTMQAIYFCEKCGFSDDFNERHPTIVPKEISDKVIRFIKSLQHEDGYFYHPQWGTKISAGRRGRDLGWSRQMLHAHKVKPRYLLPLERTQDGKKSPYLPTYLQSIEAFREYLSELNLSKNSYSVGNLIDSQVSQIRAAGQEYVDMLLEWLAEHQRTDTGLWEDELTYNAVNGAYKISMSHPGLGSYVPNAQKCVESAVKAVLMDKELTYIFECACPWSIIRGVFKGMPQHLGFAKTKETHAMIMDHAEELIRKSREKILRCRQDDTSYSYFSRDLAKTAERSQGVPVSVPNCAEGDINSTGAAVKSVPFGICCGLGIPYVPIFTPLDKELYFDIIRNAEPVKKKYKNPYGDTLPEPYR